MREHHHHMDLVLAPYATNGRLAPKREDTRGRAPLGEGSIREKVYRRETASARAWVGRGAWHERGWQARARENGNSHESRDNPEPAAREPRGNAEKKRTPHRMAGRREVYTG